MVAGPRTLARTAFSRGFSSVLDDRSTLAIAAGAGFAALAMNFWIPFLPLYMKHLGATSNTDAVFWAGLATTAIGIGRLVSGPVWGVLSDRLGRKMMYVRALYFATGSILIAAAAQEPWHVVAAMLFQGLFSGFIPAAVALTSVTVPENRLAASLGTVSAAQYLGSMAGPAIGAGLAAFFGMRGAIVAGAVMPGIAATFVILLVPPDTRKPTTTSTDQTAPREHFWDIITFQFALAVFLYFFLFSAGQLIRLSAPVAMGDIQGGDASEAVIGLAFTLTGVASVVGVTVIARRFVRAGGMARAIAIGSAVTAIAHLLLAFSPNVASYIVFFCLISLVQAALIPASNTLIASSVHRDRRGAAFGLASSAQALAFIAGPMAAAAITAVSFRGGYSLVGILFLAVGLLVAWRIREPKPDLA